jgi:hypothetical protein
MRIGKSAESGRPWRSALWIVSILVGLWLISPAFFAQHVEGFTANIKAAAVTANRGELMRSDLLYPVVTEFIYFTRGGLVAILRASDALFGDVGDLDFRLLMIMSLGLLLWGSVVVAARASEVRPWQALVAILLVPGITETAFFLNDNLPSAALAVAAMALAACSDRRLAYVASGCLAGAAVLCRPDAILIAPAVAGLIWMRHAQLRPLAVRLLYVLAGAAGIVALGAAWLGVTPLDAYLISDNFMPPAGGYTRQIVLLMFFGAASGLLLAIGLVASVRWSRERRDRYRWLAVFLLVPAVIVAAGLKISVEIRYVYPLLAPFVAVHGGRGLAALAEGLKGRYRGPAMAASAALILLAIAPPFPVAVRDGPRAAVGRLWMPLLWWRWEKAMAANFRTVDRLVAAAHEAPRTLVISTHFNDDFFLKQRLLAAGFRAVEPERVLKCSGFSLYAKGPRLVAQIRGETQYGLIRVSQPRLRALLLHRSLSCRTLHEFDQAFLTVYGEDIRSTFAERFSPEVYAALLPRVGHQGPAGTAFNTASLFTVTPWRPVAAAADVPQYQRLGRLHAFALSRAELAALHRDAGAYSRKPAGVGFDRGTSFERFEQAYARRCKDPSQARLRDLPLCLPQP